ncbi:MAG TPA: hypothetical protein ENJ42_01200 [Hellea balneolensis]|uniref:Uncharacterized protein n=1 Tax=Hellea balneolensis TaxID=287478 RepID=A0A7C5LT68_9PROT|nr:hypothetical protein [Hellea balneolensis]
MIKHYMMSIFWILLALPQLALAQTDFDKKHEQCLKQIAQDAEIAFEEALIWQSQGGGRRAKHCVAMALFALDHADEAAFRLEKLAKAPDGGDNDMRAGYYAESADLWLEAKLPRKAYDAATAGLDLKRDDVDLRIVRARAYAALGRWDYAEIDLTSALAFHPDEPRALRFRADARLRQDKLDLAKQDIDRAVQLDGKNIDTLLVRGKINEALRLAKLTTDGKSPTEPRP